MEFTNPLALIVTSETWVLHCVLTCLNLDSVTNQTGDKGCSLLMTEGTTGVEKKIECLTTPQHQNRSTIGCQNKVDVKKRKKRCLNLLMTLI